MGFRVGWDLGSPRVQGQGCPTPELWGPPGVPPEAVAVPTDPPTVTLSIQPQTVQEGERVVFTCMATANPEIKGYR